MTLLPLLLVAAKPLMRDFIGLNTHTVQFKTDLYRPVTSLLRNYHPVAWDIGDDPSSKPEFPMTRNGVNWTDLYGAWKKAGYRTEATAMFESIDPKRWTDIPKQSAAYGEAFARFFGPTGKDWIEAIEVGNEPSQFNEDQYRQMFEGMAKGVRKGDPKMKIATCAVAKGKEDKYSKDIACLEGLESLIDVLNVHTYSFVEGWPTWRRSFPEDPSIRYLKQVQEIVDWRNARAPGRQVWVTEFGYDSTTKPNKPTGDFAKWEGVSDVKQAEYIVRSYLAFSAMDVDRAYLYWFNDDDSPQLHGASGLTRNYQPKPSFHAVAHLLKTLGDTRFDRALLRQPGGVYAYQYRGATGRVVVAWSATGAGKKAQVTLPVVGKVLRAETMPMAEGAAEKAPFKASPGKVTLTVGEAPVYLWLK